MSGCGHVSDRLSGQYAPFGVRPVEELGGYHPVLFRDSVRQLGRHCPPLVAVRFEVRYPCLQLLHAGGAVPMGTIVSMIMSMFLFFVHGRNTRLDVDTSMLVCRQHDKLAATDRHCRELSATYTALHRPHGYTEALGCFFVADEVAVSGGHVSDMLSCVAATWQGRPMTRLPAGCNPKKGRTGHSRLRNSSELKKGRARG